VEVIGMPKVEPIDNAVGLNNGGVYEAEIRGVLEKYVFDSNATGFTHVAVLSPGGAAIIEGPNVGDSIEKIEGMICDRQFVDHMNALFDLTAKINERRHKAGAILEVAVQCEELTFALNLFGRKNVREDRYFFTEVIIPIVTTRAYLGALVQRNSAKLIEELRALVASKKPAPSKP
jgi:hypothetical protein